MSYETSHFLKEATTIDEPNQASVCLEEGNVMDELDETSFRIIEPDEASF